MTTADGGGRITGIRWIGPVFHAGGYGGVSRNFLLGLSQLGVAVEAVNLGPDDRLLLDEETLQKIERLTESNAGSRPVAVIHWEPEAYRKVKTGRVAGRIGCTIFETDRIPTRWAALCNQMDEIWVPSQFNVETFAQSGVERHKLQVVPYGVDTGFFKPIKEQLPIPGKRTFVFLYVAFFDWRKGFDLLLDAYGREFTDRDDVTLVLKVSEDCHSTASFSEVEKLVGEVRRRAGAPHITIISQRLTSMEMRQLYSACDLYISTDRANGWGIPCMEAMAMGKPAATINWSGSTQFMKAGNSLLIEPTGRLVPVDSQLTAARPMYAGHCWAEVTVEQVRQVMRYAVENPELLDRIARCGMDFIRTYHTLAAAAALLRQRVLQWEARAVSAPRKHGWPVWLGGRAMAGH